ncbi:MAG: HAD hydrolase-like protein [Phycisphaerales bacterium]|jgi:histidinol phosphatase-like enzyme
MPRPACFIDRHDLERAVATDPSSVGDELRRLRDAGFAIVAASNEPTVGAGTRTEREVQDADRLLAAGLAIHGGESPIDRFYWCPFSPEAELDRYRFDHPWRKPRTGMLLQAAEDLDLDLSDSWMLAGREDDLTAARAAGMRIATLSASGDASMSLDLASAVDAVLGASTERVPDRSADTPEVEVLNRHPDVVLAASVAGAALPTSPPASTRVAPEPSPRRSGGKTASTTSQPRPSRPEQPVVATTRTSPRTSESTPAVGGRAGRDEALLSAMRDLTEELRQTRAGARDLTGGRVVALLLELGVLLAAAIGLMQSAEPMLLAKWFLGAVLLQLAAIALLLFDRR